MSSFRPGFTVNVYHHRRDYSVVSSLGGDSFQEDDDNENFSGEDDREVEDPLLLGLSSQYRLRHSINRLRCNPPCSSPAAQALYDSKRSLSALSLEPLELNERVVNSSGIVVPSSLELSNNMTLNNQGGGASAKGLLDMKKSTTPLLQDEDLDSVQQSLDKICLFHADGSVRTGSEDFKIKCCTSNATAMTTQSSPVGTHQSGLISSVTALEEPSFIKRRPSLHRRVSIQMLPAMDQIFSSRSEEDENRKSIARPDLVKAVSHSYVIGPPPKNGRRHHRRNTAQIAYFDIS